jgi:hypothetical protein
MTEIIGGVLLLIVMPLLGAYPLGTKNLNLARVLEILQGLIAVGIAQYCFPGQGEWDFIALIAWSAGRFWNNQGVGWLGIAAGYILHDPWGGSFVALLALISLTLLRSPAQAQWAVIVLIPLMEALRHLGQGSLAVVAVFLSVFLYWVAAKQPGATQAFQAFRGTSLDDLLPARRFGEKAARLAELKRAGFPVPPGWVLQPGDDPIKLLDQINPLRDQTWIVRISPIAGGHYAAIENLRSSDNLWRSLVRAFEIYDSSSSERYRAERGIRDGGTAVLLQHQVDRRYSGIAYLVEKHRNSLSRADVPEALLAEVEALTVKAAGLPVPPKFLEWIYDGRVWIIQTGD